MQEEQSGLCKEGNYKDPLVTTQRITEEGKPLTYQSIFLISGL
jgi:hypothetical protein